MAYFLRFTGKEIKLPPGESVIGRERGCSVCIDAPAVSRRHARILLVQDALSIQDLGSKNGIKLNGVRIEGAAPLTDGDFVMVGTYEFEIRRSGAFDTFNGEVSAPYRAPLFRTCVSCRALSEGGERCAKCGAELFVPGDYPTRTQWLDPQGRRSETRTTVSFRAVYVSPTLTLDGEVSDLSTGGAFFASALADATGTACDLVIYHDGDKDPIQIDAEVVRVSAKPRGLGLKFLRLPRSVQRWLLSVNEENPK